MRDYEILFILKPYLSDEEYEKLVEDFKGWITAEGGEVLKSNVRGIEEFAYEIDKMTQGYYVEMVFSLDPEKIAIIKEKMRVTESFLREMIINLEELIPQYSREKAIA